MRQVRIKRHSRSTHPPRSLLPHRLPVVHAQLIQLREDLVRSGPTGGSILLLPAQNEFDPITRVHWGLRGFTHGWGQDQDKKGKFNKLPCQATHTSPMLILWDMYSFLVSSLCAPSAKTQ